MRGFRFSEPALGLALDPWRVFDRALRQIANGEAAGAVGGAARYPALDVRTSPDGAVVTALVPGLTSADFDITVQGETLTIKGRRAPVKVGEKATLHRRERPSGAFARTLTLPFPVDGAKVTARCANGVLQIDLPRLEADKPRRIAVHG